MSEDDDIRYRLRPRERIAVTPPRGDASRPAIAVPPAPEPLDRSDPLAVDPPAISPAGSEPAIELAPLDVPVTMRFGGAAVQVERTGATVTLVLPGGVRIVGDQRDAAALAAALAVRPPRG